MSGCKLSHYLHYTDKDNFLENDETISAITHYAGYQAKWVKWSQQDGSVGKGAYHQGNPEFDLRDPHDERRELTPQAVP